MNMVQPEAPRSRPGGVLRAVLRRCRARRAGAPPVVVFDLDGTLMDNRPRTLAILREFAAHCRDRDADLARRLDASRPADLAYLLADSLDRMGAREHALAAEVEAFWRDRFFADGHLVHDTAVPGAVEFARACHEAGAVLVYLTGRDRPFMGSGTLQSLRDLGFPIDDPATELILKPDAATPDEAFKRLAAPGLARLGEVVAAFDNEPGNCNVFLASYPDAHVVFVETQHMPGAPALSAGVETLCDFRME